MVLGDVEATLVWHMESETPSCMVTMSMPFGVDVLQNEVMRSAYVSYHGLNGQFVRGFLLWPDSRVHLLTSNGAQADVVLEGGVPVAINARGLQITISKQEQ
jgi:predicted TIM-barrel enzyme